MKRLMLKRSPEILPPLFFHIRRQQISRPEHENPARIRCFILRQLIVSALARKQINLQPLVRRRRMKILHPPAVFPIHRLHPLRQFRRKSNVQIRMNQIMRRLQIDELPAENRRTQQHPQRNGQPKSPPYHGRPARARCIG